MLEAWICFLAWQKEKKKKLYLRKEVIEDESFLLAELQFIRMIRNIHFSKN
jgi:hypothetical protein